MRLVWTAHANKTRAAAIDHISRNNPVAALNQLDEIECQTDMLAQYPEIGRPGRIDGTRELVISRTPFIVVYRIRLKAQRIELFRFLHGARKWPPDGN